MFDRDGSGSIDFEEIKAALEKLEIKLDDNKLKELMKQIDYNDDGTL